MEILTKEEFDNKFEKLPLSTKRKFKRLIGEAERMNSVSFLKERSGHEGNVYFMRIDFRYRAFFTIIDDKVIFIDVASLNGKYVPLIFSISSSFHKND